ncbi:MAG: hypothetical protein JXR95_02770 [Deltaproteobacteria bacterium]|nr:hypothetical protein [Deltaproteobacteria bacterium]
MGHIRFIFLFSVVLMVFSGCDDSSDTNHCGNGVIDTGEECDGNDTDGVTCQSLGYVTGNVSCADDCTLIVNCTGSCGNGETEEGEDCDGDDIPVPECADLPNRHYVGGSVGCNNDCTLDLSQCESCGNSIVDEGEDCDGAVMPETMCSELAGTGYYEGSLSCGSNCLYDVSECNSCGNGVKDDGEECDGDDFGELSCADYNLRGGSLSCNSCSVDTSGCFQSFADMSVGAWHGCGIDNYGDIWCWGLNEADQTGTGIIESEIVVPSKVLSTEVTSFAKVSAGAYHSCAVDIQGKIWCWGADPEVATVSIAVRVNTPDEVIFTDVGSGAVFTCALDTLGGIWCWGQNGWGQLGVPLSTTTLNEPTKIETGILFSSISVGAYHVCATDTAGNAWCWGRNDQGQSGSGSSETRLINPTEVDMPPATDFVTIQVGGYHSCALNSSGSAWCWGRNTYGQVGNGEFGSDIDNPESVDNGIAYSWIKGGGELHTCGVDTAGKLWCWGGNTYGNLGDGTTTPAYSPTEVDIENVLFTRVYPGNNYTCALDDTGAAWCWGNNGYGQLGNSTLENSYYPVPVNMPVE